MIKNRNETSAAMDKALKNLEQAKARYEAERKKENEKRRKAQNHHKYLMGGIVAKYFPECYQYEEKTECDLVSGSCFGRVQAGGRKT